MFISIAPFRDGRGGLKPNYKPGGLKPNYKLLGTPFWSARLL
ncbi:hypothetical protein [Kamptonema formosum]|nr:hypothetical protein [Oscillatoria sp. PCC 10802]